MVKCCLLCKAADVAWERVELCNIQLVTSHSHKYAAVIMKEAVKGHDM